MNNKDNIDARIAKYLDGRATAEEIVRLEEWRQASLKNEEYYKGIVGTQKLVDSLDTFTVDTEKAWGIVRDRIDSKKKGKRSKVSRFRIMSYAASIMLLCFIGYNWFSSGVTPDVYTSLKKSEHLLQDGSKVILSANSALTRLKESEREYSFVGSASFHVDHMEESPFIVHMDDIMVKDLGTVFDIDYSPQSDTVHVKVTEGEVQFYTKSNIGIIVEQGEEGIYILSKNRFYKRSLDQNNPVLSAVFSDAKLGDVINHLSYSFRKHVIVKDENLKECNITVDFSKASYELVKEIIQEAMDISIQESETTIVISGGGC